jgi:rod shape determining protein RodA
MASTTLRRRKGHGHHRMLASLRHDPSSPRRHLDWVLLVAVALITAVGLLMVFSTSRGASPPYYYAKAAKQLLYVLIGVVVGGVVASIDYRHYRDWAPFIYGAAVALLVLVLSPLGSSHKGSQGWFDLGMFQLQPSELAKVAVIVGISGLAAQYRGELTLSRVAVLLAVSGVPIALVLAQGDLGTALVFVAMVPTILWIGGAKARHLVVLALAGIIVATGIVSSGALKSYQKDRLTVFVQQDNTKVSQVDRQGAAYNLDQAKIAIGHGGFWGRGLFNGSQTRTGQVPEQDTDFIFTAAAEQFGFVGAGVILALMGLMVVRVWRTAQLARDDFGTYVCVGVLAMLLFQIFENVGMTMGIMPITGIPLPFMSYGGSSMLANFAALGLVLNVHSRRFT